ncbi:MAG: 2Fe-2S iron-sulfur cluster binding domain-containing protein [Kordiimonadaceae bacterium]|nr:2Fe-2S iron-sulfur cluster binding domain-containing protein [Kordiimonadaceae bacterium]
MVKVCFVDLDGKEHHVEGRNGKTVMDAAVKNAVPTILAECGGTGACATCHVYVDEAWVSKIPPAEDAEQSALEFTDNPKENSRLSCQVRLTEALDGIKFHLPPCDF